MTMKKELIQTRNRKMNKKMIVKNEIMEEDWTNNEDWLKSYNIHRSMQDNDCEVQVIDGDDQEREMEERETPVDDLEEDLEYYKAREEDEITEEGYYEKSLDISGSSHPDETIIP